MAGLGEAKTGRNAAYSAGMYMSTLSAVTTSTGK